MELHSVLFIIGIVCAVLGGIFLVVSIAMFFGFNVPNLFKESSGSLEQSQIEEIRSNSAIAKRKGKVNVFEDLEKRAKVKKSNTHSLNAGGNTSQDIARAPQPAIVSSEEGTSVLNKKIQKVNPNFVIEKNIVFVSTTEVL